MEEINDDVETVKSLTPRSATIKEGKCQSDGVICGLRIYYTHWSSLCSGPRSSERFPRASVLGFGLLSVFLLAVFIGLTKTCLLIISGHYLEGDAAADLSPVKANLTERLQARDQLINQLKANLTKKTREVDRLQSLMGKAMEKIYDNAVDVKTLSSRSSAKQEGPRRFLRESVLGLGLLSVFLLAGLIGLAVHYHNSVGVAAADLCAVKANLSSVTEERDNLTERLQASDQLLSSVTEERDSLKANLTEKTKEVDRLQCLMDKPMEEIYDNAVDVKTLSSRSSTIQEGPRRFLRASVLGLGLLSVFLLAGLIGLAVHSGWRKFGSSCYLLSTEKASWEQSRDNCRARGADLVIVDSKEEQVIEEEGTWKWVDGSPLNLNLTFWNKKPPDNGGGDSYYGEVDCVNINPSTNGWNDQSCRKNLHWIYTFVLVYQRRGSDLEMGGWISTESEILLCWFTKSNAWIGLSDREEEATWKWVDGSPLNLKSATIKEGKCQSDGVSCGLRIYYTHWSSLCSGPRSSERFPRASVLGFGLLSVFLLAVFIGLTKTCLLIISGHYLEGDAAADLSPVKANLTERLQARDQLINQLKANLTKRPERWTGFRV
ncbi:hypothetical protein F7725_002339 [Dissostichus mawsoni]|uniref:C-type lectin domain-containing protein n=1 Tax=Dissostichus mawsoni TaxID=36200 RepID=A0A7J5Y2C6_DISMA|nr:hypothetical protein F7725_002339 [Dissostichus mawsoni]